MYGNLLEVLLGRRISHGVLPEFAISETVRLLEECKYSIGGFGVSAGSPPYVETTYFASSLLALAKESLERSRYNLFRDACARYFNSLWKRGSGFSDIANGEVFVFSTYFAVLSLRLLDLLEDRVVNGCRSFLESNLTIEGLPSFKDFPADLSTCFWAAITEYLLEKSPRLYDNRISEFIRSTSNNDGSFSTFQAPDLRVPGLLQPTAEAVLLLNMLRQSSSLENPQLRFILGCRRGVLQFGESLTSSTSPSASFLGSIALYGLGKLKLSHVHFQPEIFPDLWIAFSKIHSMLSYQDAASRESVVELPPGEMVRILAGKGDPKKAE